MRVIITTLGVAALTAIAIASTMLMLNWADDNQPVVAVIGLLFNLPLILFGWLIGMFLLLTREGW